MWHGAPEGRRAAPGRGSPARFRAGGGSGRPRCTPSRRRARGQTGPSRPIAGFCRRSFAYRLPIGAARGGGRSGGGRAGVGVGLGKGLCSPRERARPCQGLGQRSRAQGGMVGMSVRCQGRVRLGLGKRLCFPEGAGWHRTGMALPELRRLWTALRGTGWDGWGVSAGPGLGVDDPCGSLSAQEIM